MAEKKMRTAERRLAERDFISMRRKTTTRELAETFDVSVQTIKTDLIAICEFTGFYTVVGRHGGVFAMEGWYSNGYKRFSHTQKRFLEGLRDGLQNEADKAMLSDIINGFAPFRDR